MRGDIMTENAPEARSRKSKMKRRPIIWDDAKIEIAKEIGLWERVQEHGWAGLTAEESGRLGGILSARYPGKAPKEEKRSSGSKGRKNNNKN